MFGFLEFFQDDRIGQFSQGIIVEAVIAVNRIAGIIGNVFELGVFIGIDLRQFLHDRLILQVVAAGIFRRIVDVAVGAGKEEVGA